MRRALRFNWLLFRMKHGYHISQPDARSVLDGLLELSPRNMDIQLLNRCLAVLHPEIADPDYKAPGQENVLGNIRNSILSQEAAQLQDDLPPQKQENPPQRRRYRPALAVVIVLISVLVMGTAIAYALGYPIWNDVFHWGEEQLQINISVPSPSSSSEPAVEKQYAGVGRGDAFDLKLEELQMDPKLPQLPAAYTLTGLDSSIGTSTTQVAAIYKAEDKQLHISVDMIDSENGNFDISVEKDERPYEIITIQGTSYNFFENMNTSEVFWLSPPYMIQIGGNITRDELKSLINNMNGGTAE